MSQYLSPVIGATALWLTRAYPSPPATTYRALAHIQARQAVTVAAWLRYPTELDAELVHLAGPGGSARLDSAQHGFAAREVPSGCAEPWRSWVDEVVASWAACLLGDGEQARTAVTQVANTEHATGLVFDFRRLLTPDELDLQAGALLRHRDLLEPVAGLHRAALMDRLSRAGQLSG